MPLYTIVFIRNTACSTCGITQYNVKNKKNTEIFRCFFIYNYIYISTIQTNWDFTEHITVGEI